jgi:hypothetical protein
MGLAISRLAVKGKSHDTVAQDLGLTATGEIIGYGEAVFTGRTLRTGWLYIVVKQCEHQSSIIFIPARHSCLAGCKGTVEGRIDFRN